MEEKQMSKIKQENLQAEEKVGNPLGEQRIKELIEANTKPKPLGITEEDYTKSICTHRFKGEQMVVSRDNYKVKCKICSAEFMPRAAMTSQDVNRMTTDMIDLFHTIKLMWVDVPDKTAMEFFQAMAVIEKIPQMYDIAKANYATHTNTKVSAVTYPQPYTGPVYNNSICNIPPLQLQPYNNMKEDNDDNED
jgi:predicted lipase